MMDETFKLLPALIQNVRLHTMSHPEPNAVGALAVRYEGAPVIRAMLALVPGWGAADQLMNARAQEIKQDRLRTFFDELARGEIALSPEVLSSNDFLHFYFKTVEAVVRTRRVEKIEMFARLLCRGLHQGSPEHLDEYEEMIEVLFELSHREFAVLSSLREFEIQTAGEVFDNDVLRIRSYWQAFMNHIEIHYGISTEEFDAFMERILRTGMYSRNTGTFWDDDPRIGKTTPQFAKLSQFVASNAT